MKNEWKKWVTLLNLLFLLCVGLLSGCKKEIKAAPLKITVNSWIGFAPLFLAQEKGFFAKHGTALEIINVEDAGARKATMIAKQVDGYASSVDNFPIDSTMGVSGKIVMCFDESHGGDGIVAKKSIKTIADLKGKKVAFQPGFPGHFLLLHVLKKNGLSQKDIVEIDMDSDKAGAAFAAGHLDAAVTWEPWLSKAEAMADGHKLITSDQLPGLIVDTLVFRDEVLVERGEEVKGVMKAWFEALDYWQKNPEEANQIMAKASKLSVEDFKAMTSGVKYFDYKRNVEYFGEKTAQGDIYKYFDAAGDYWLEIGLIKNKSKAAEKIDQSFVAKLY